MLKEYLLNNSRSYLTFNSIFDAEGFSRKASNFSTEHEESTEGLTWNALLKSVPQRLVTQMADSCGMAAS